MKITKKKITRKQLDALSFRVSRKLEKADYQLRALLEQADNLVSDLVGALDALEELLQ